jgi:hypothetical protein
METVPCMKGDGICTIPDHTVTVREGRVGVRLRSEILREFPDLDLRTSNLRPFEFDGSHGDLLTAVRGLENVGDLEDVRDDTDDVGGVAVMEPLGLHEAVAAAIADANVTNGLIVLCSPCGHQWIVDL